MVTVFGLLDRYAYPALRKALALELYRRGLNEGEIGEALGVSRSLVSRYLRGSRGLALESLDERVLEAVKRLADEVYAGGLARHDVEYRLSRLALEAASSKLFCSLHAKLDRSVDPSACTLCQALFRPQGQ